MLTPIDIQQKSFKGGIGYKKKDVDTFMATLMESYEYIYKENIDLNEKVRVLSNSLSQYKTIEKSLQKALILAQSAAEDVKNTASTSAKVIEEEARIKARDIVAQARKEMEIIHKKTLALASQMEIYKAQFKQLAGAQLDILESDTYKIDVKKLDSYLLAESEAESVAFIDKADEDVKINKLEVEITKQTEQMINAVNLGFANNNDDLVNDEFYNLVAEVIGDAQDEQSDN